MVDGQTTAPVYDATLARTDACPLAGSNVTSRPSPSTAVDWSGDGRSKAFSPTPPPVFRGTAADQDNNAALAPGADDPAARKHAHSVASRMSLTALKVVAGAVCGCQRIPRFSALAPPTATRIESDTGPSRGRIWSQDGDQHHISVSTSVPPPRLLQRPRALPRTTGRASQAWQGADPPKPAEPACVSRRPRFDRRGATPRCGQAARLVRQAGCTRVQVSVGCRTLEARLCLSPCWVHPHGRHRPEAAGLCTHEAWVMTSALSPLGSDRGAAAPAIRQAEAGGKAPLGSSDGGDRWVVRRALSSWMP